jgi:hypothetical protein
MKYFWFLIALCFLVYGIYDFIYSIKEIFSEDLSILKIIGKIVTSVYVIGCSIYIIFIKIIKSHE